MSKESKNLEQITDFVKWYYRINIVVHHRDGPKGIVIFVQHDKFSTITARITPNNSNAFTVTSVLRDLNKEFKSLKKAIKYAFRVCDEEAEAFEKVKAKEEKQSKKAQAKAVKEQEKLLAQAIERKATGKVTKKDIQTLNNV